MDSRRSDDKIRALVKRAIDTSDPAELGKILVELKSALKKHLQRLRETAAQKPPLPRRRKNDYGLAGEPIKPSGRPTSWTSSQSAVVNKERPRGKYAKTPAEPPNPTNLTKKLSENFCVAAIASVANPSAK